MAKAVIAQRNGRREESHSIEDDVLRDADRILELVLMDELPVDTRQRRYRPRPSGSGQRSKRTSGCRRRSSSSLESGEALKKVKTDSDDDGSRLHGDVAAAAAADDDDDVDGDGSGDCATIQRDGGPVGRFRREDAPPRPRLVIGGAKRARAPLAEPEDSTVTPEVERDVGRKLRLLKCRSRTSDDAAENDKGDDEVDHGFTGEEEQFDDVDGPSGAEEAEDDETIVYIANKLRDIGDDVNSRIDLGTMTKSASTLSISMLAIDGIQDFVSNLTYEQFQDVVNRNLGNEPGVEQVTVMFRLAKAAVRQLGSRTPAVAEVKRIAMDYFRKNVSSWVSQNGGWGGIAQQLRSG